ncbi:MAG: amino acid-binding protein, partial [Rikenellaceae bacterium]
MKIKQLSVFLENKTGRINDMVDVLSTYGINMSAFSLAESAEFGIMRIIVADCAK